MTSLRDRVDVALGTPEVDAALRRVEQAAKMPVATTQLADPLDAAQVALLSGGEVPAGLGDDLFAAQQAQQAHARQSLACQELMRRLHRERTDRRRSNADAGLEVLTAALDEILAEGPGVLTKLDDIDNAEDAIRTGVADAWRRAGQLADELAELRTVQLEIAADVFDPPAPPSISVTPLPPQPSMSTITMVRTFGAVRDFAEQWEGARDLPRQDDDRLEALRWTCSDDAQPWLPSVVELRAAVDAARHQREQQRIDRLAEMRPKIKVTEQRADRQFDRAAHNAEARSFMTAESRALTEGRRR